MISQAEIQHALKAADQPSMVESPEALAAALKEWQECEIIGIDTEFVRERTWRADLGLVQLSDGRKVWLVDPLQCGPLDPLKDLLETAAIIKVLHAPSEDLDVLLHNTGAVPRPLFDTQLACALLGQPLQMGYHKTVEWLLDITIDKGETRSNWLKRPLSAKQLHYAALDVCLLPVMFKILRARLATKNRLHWLEEDSERMLGKALEPADPNEAWKRVAGYKRLDGLSLALLQALSLWREHVAEKLNMARGFIVQDKVLMSLVHEKPRDLQALADLRIWHPGAIKKHGQAVIDTINRVLADGTRAEAPEILLTKHRPMIKAMKDIVSEKAEQLSVDPAVLASRRELENLILSSSQSAPPERFTGWREKVITEQLIGVKQSLGH
jgi:ribonuclease D